MCHCLLVDSWQAPDRRCLAAGMGQSDEKRAGAREQRWESERRGRWLARCFIFVAHIPSPQPTSRPSSSAPNINPTATRRTCPSSSVHSVPYRQVASSCYISLWVVGFSGSSRRTLLSCCPTYYVRLYIRKSLCLPRGLVARYHTLQSPIISGCVRLPTTCRC